MSRLVSIEVSSDGPFGPGAAQRYVEKHTQRLGSFEHHRCADQQP